MYEYFCEQCGKKFTRKTKVVGYPYCKGCKKKQTWEEHPELRDSFLSNRKESMMDKYGVDNPSKLASVRDKISEKAVERFSNPDEKQRIRNLREETCLQRYGYKAPALNPEILEKGLETQRSNNSGLIGWEDAEKQKASEELAHTEESYRKRHKTCLDKYGETHHFKNKEVLSTQWDSYMRRTGYEHPAKDPNIKHSGSKGYFYNDIHFDSSWELAYYIWLKDQEIDFIYHPDFSLEYLDDNGELHCYWPDFLVEGQFVEIKGDHFFNEKGEPYNQYAKEFWWNKYQALLDNKVKIIRFDEVRKYLQYVKKMYGGGYLKSFKRK